MTDPVVVLTIAGSDSGGGAGIQADLKTFSAHGVFGTSALSALTAQNTVAVLDVVVVDPAFLVAQIEAVLGDFSVAAVKTGMLANAALVGVVADFAAQGRLPNLVVDPVMISTTGHRLLEPDAVDAYRNLLLPHTCVVTPNLAETALLTRRDESSMVTAEDRVDAAGALRALGVTTVVVKGGHLVTEGGPLDPGSPDLVVGPAGTVVLPAERVPTHNDHGTGCSLSAAIAANLARGLDTVSAVSQAKDYVHRALWGASTWRLGAGRGPIDHFGWSNDDRAASQVDGTGL